MTYQERYLDALKDVQALIRQSGRGPKRTIMISPEVAERLNALNAPQGPAPVPAADDPAVASAGTLAALADIVSECRKCSLCNSRTQTVFGVGNPNADLVFVGEAPGAEEDRQGVPFVGAAGQLLTDIIEKGMQRTRDEVYICNVLKCRPPENRDPSPEEIRMCEGFLLRQLDLIQPKVICALGKFAAQTLLKTDETVGRMRGKWHTYHGIPLRVTYHPSYLLRTPADKKKCWEDIQEVMKRLEAS